MSSNNPWQLLCKVYFTTLIIDDPLIISIKTACMDEMVYVPWLILQLFWIKHKSFGGGVRYLMVLTFCYLPILLVCYKYSIKEMFCSLLKVLELGVCNCFYGPFPTWVGDSQSCGLQTSCERFPNLVNLIYSKSLLTSCVWVCRFSFYMDVSL